LKEPLIDGPAGPGRRISSAVARKRPLPQTAPGAGDDGEIAE